MDLGALLHRCRAHLAFLIVAAVLAAAAAVSVGAWQATERHTAEARILLLPFDSSETLSESGNVRPVDFDRYVANEMAVLGSTTVAQRVTGVGLEPEQLRAAVDISQVGESDVVSVRATTADPAAARDAANGVATAYLALRREDAVAAADRKIEQLDHQLLELGQELADDDRRLSDPATTDATLGTVATRREVNGQLYGDLLARQRELFAERELKRGSAQLVVPADEVEAVPTRGPVSLAAGGGVLGALAALASVSTHERLTRRLRRREDVEALGVPVPIVAELPHDAEVPRGGGVPTVQRLPDAPFAAAVRLLRRAVQVTWEPKPPWVVVVTSPQRHDGRSTVAVNLATAFARSELRTVIVDGDLRQPGFGGQLDLTTSCRGLSELMGADRPRPFVPQPVDGVDDLVALHSGPLVPRPDELLSRERGDQVFASLRADADVVVVDAPPVLGHPDASLLSFHADAVLLVVRLGADGERELRAALSALASGPSRPIAIVLNDVGGS